LTPYTFVIAPPAQNIQKCVYFSNIGIYDTVVFFIQKAKDIAQMIGNFMGSIGEIAMGNIGAAVGALENGLAQGLTLVISFLAKLIRLDGVTAKIRAVLAKITGKVENMMVKVAKWIKEKAGKMFGKDKNMPKDKKEAESATQPVDTRLGKAREDAEKILIQPKATPKNIINQLDALKRKHSLKEAKLVKKDELYSIEVQINPTAHTRDIALDLSNYPGSGLDPMTRSEDQLWDDLDEKNTTLSGETNTKDKSTRAAMAELRLFTGMTFNASPPFYSGDSLIKARQIFQNHRGKKPKAVTDLSIHESNGGHLIDRHITNGSGIIKNKRDVALRVFFNNPYTGNGFKAGAFNSKSSALNAINKSLGLIPWTTSVRKHIINNTSNVARPDSTVNYSVPSAHIMNNPSSTIFAPSVLPSYLSTYTYYTHVLTTARGHRKLFDGDSGSKVAPFVSTIPIINDISNTQRQVYLRIIPSNVIDGGFHIHSGWPQ
jgi:hypothetical protein